MVDSTIPRYTIDLALPPRDRYTTIATMYKPQLEHLTSLFDDLLRDVGIPFNLHGTINRVARLLLRKLHSKTETEEIRGVSRATGVSMYLLVAFNVLLDLLMGCTSGGVKTQNGPVQPPRMLHFRTLDWGMDPLRAVIVQLDFINSKTSGMQILCSSVTYVGYVGVLTGVRGGLSMSLNFRGIHNAQTLRERMRFRLHHLLVLLGYRQSISSMLRDCLFDQDESVKQPKSLVQLTNEIPKKRSTAAYLIFSDGKSTITIEKDFDSGVVRDSMSFITITNHDLQDEESVVVESKETQHFGPTRRAMKVAAIKDIIDESADRRNCMMRRWRSRVRNGYRERESDSTRRRLPSEGRTSRRSRKSLASEGSIRSPNTKPEDHGSPTLEEVESTLALHPDEVVEWLCAWPMTNECTHYAVVLDPTAGQVTWARKYPQPITEPVDQMKRSEMGLQ